MGFGSAIGPVRGARAGAAACVGAAAGIAWEAGFISNFLIAPTGAGLDLAGSYTAFQFWPKVGIAVSLLLWSGAALFTGWYFSGSSGPAPVRVLAAFGLPAVLSLGPAVAVSSAVSHLVPGADIFAYQDWPALPLIVAGAAVLAAAPVAALLRRR